MGMYTELVFKCDVSTKDPFVVEIMDALFGEKNIESISKDNFPSHPFFSKGGCYLVGQCCSYYHHPKILNDIHRSTGYISIFSRSDLKNYDNEIEDFIDWIQPYIDEETGKCIGYKWYEGDLQPTLLFKE